MSEFTKIVLTERDMPTHWYNINTDLPAAGVELPHLAINRCREDGFSRRHGAMPQVIIQLVQNGFDDFVRLFPRLIPTQNFFDYPPDEERVKQEFVGLMEQQISMMLPVGR